MTKELVINVTQNGFRIALLNAGELIEYHVEEKDHQFTVGDIYLGTVRKIAPDLNASFVDIGYKKDAFLHYSDLGPQFNSFNKFVQLAIKGKNLSPKLTQFSPEPAIDKLGKIAGVLSKDQQILVQVVKEPIANKGPRLSSELAIAGRYMILVPFSDAVNISQKIVSSEERKRLTRLITSIKPPNFGVIIRTAAEGRGASELDKDLKDLFEKWLKGVNNLKKALPHDKIIGEMNRASSILRDMLNESFDSVVVDEKEAYEEVRQYIRKIAPEKENIAKRYQGKAKIFEHFGIEKQLKMLFGQTVNLKNGGYLIIEHTEAMHVVDVNSGSKTTAEQNQGEMALQVNLAAAQEIARQIRLRDMGGIIVVDFIDVKSPEHKRAIYQKMKEYLKEDRSKITLLPLSQFSLMQLTRQRVRPEMNVVTQEQCPSCRGSGKIDASIAVADQVEQSLRLVLLNQNESGITLFVHPYLHAYFTSGFPSSRLKWFFQYKKWINISEDTSMGINEFKFVNKQGENIELIA